MAYSILKVHVDVDAILYVDNEYKADLLKNVYYRLELRKGVYDLLIISAKENTVKYSCVYTMADNDMEDMLRINLRDSLQKVLDRKCRAERCCIGTSDDGYSAICYGEIEEKKLPFHVTWEEGFNSQGYLIFMVGGQICKGWFEFGYDSEPDYPADGNWGVLDVDGNICLEPIYSKIIEYSDNIFLVEKDEYWGILDSENNMLVDFKYLDMKFRKNIFAKNRYNKWGCISKDGDIILDFIYDYVLDIGYAFALNIGGDNTFHGNEEYLEGGKIFLLYDSGEIIATDFSIICDDGYVGDSYHEGMYKISPDTREHIVEYGARNNKKHIIIPKQYVASYKVSENLVRVKHMNGLYGFLDLDGKEAIPCLYKEADDFCNGISVVTNQRGDTCIINTSGEHILKGIKNIIDFVGGDTIITSNDDVYDIYSLDGHNLTKGKYSKISIFSHPHIFLVTLKNSTKLGLIDNRGEILVEPIYDRIYELDSNNCNCICEKDIKQGLYNYLDGCMILPCVYDSIRINREATVKDRDTSTMKNLSGHTLLELMQDRKYGFFSMDGSEIDNRCLYDSYEFMGDNYVKVHLNDEYAIIQFTTELVDNRVVIKTTRVSFANIPVLAIQDIKYIGGHRIKIQYSLGDLQEVYYIDKSLNLVKI